MKRLSGPESDIEVKPLQSTDLKKKMQSAFRRRMAQAAQFQ
jgi:hypothetical protein